MAGPPPLPEVSKHRGLRIFSAGVGIAYLLSSQVLGVLTRSYDKIYKDLGVMPSDSGSSLAPWLIAIGVIVAVLVIGKDWWCEHKTAIVLNVVAVVILITAYFGWTFNQMMQMAHSHPAVGDHQRRYNRAMRELDKAGISKMKRFYALDDAAKESYNTGRYDQAKKFAKELSELSPEFKDNWNYGNAVQDFNVVLGRLALREGRVKEAKDDLLAAGKSPGSPQMDSFGPNMSLAKDLLEKEEKDVVLEYFELCRVFWKDNFGKLDQWKKDVKEGRKPDFGANLDY